MERKFKNLRDVGLTLQRLRAGSTSCCQVGNLINTPPFLPCGRLLRCGAIDFCTFEQLRKANTIVNLRMCSDDAIHDSLREANVELLHVPAENSLEKYETSNPAVRAWLQSVCSIFEREDLRFPILLHCRSGRDRTGIVVAALLCLLGVPEPLVEKEFAISDGAQGSDIKLALRGFRKLGGIETYLSKAVTAGKSIDIHKVRTVLRGSVAEDGVRSVAELSWLQQESQLMCRLAGAASKLGDQDEAAFWQSEAVAACAEVAGHLPAGDAAAALAYQGWALAQLRHEEEAYEALSVGVALARKGGARQQVVKRLEKEIANLATDTEIRVVEAEELLSGDLGDVSTNFIFLTIEDSGTWRAAPLPSAFTWLRSGELAASATPNRVNLPALQSLGLTQRVDTGPLGRAGVDHDYWNGMVEGIAEALLGKQACLLHSKDGFGDAGVALACFLVVHGLDDPVRKVPGQPKMTAGEAIEVLRALRPGSISAQTEEATVYQFAQGAWANHIERAQKAFCGSSRASASTKPETSAKQATAPEDGSCRTRVSGRVIQQPGDGNCLFHSLAYGLGQGNTASTLRADICRFMERNPSLEIAGTSLQEWIQMLAGSSIENYARKMAKGAQWGGAPRLQLVRI